MSSEFLELHKVDGLRYCVAYDAINAVTEQREGGQPVCVIAVAGEEGAIEVRESYDDVMDMIRGAADTMSAVRIALLVRDLTVLADAITEGRYSGQRMSEEEK